MSQLRRSAAWLSVLAFTAAMTPQALASGDGSTHIRIVDRSVEALVASGVDNSPTFQNLVSRLEASAMLVFVRCQPRQQPGPSAAGLTFLASTPSYRYVRVFIHCELPASVQLPLLAHEFQHALEVSESSTVVDATTMRHHYEHVGYHSNSDDRNPSFETKAAIAVQRQVTRELASPRRSQAVADGVQARR